jgi:hypothetical protein
VRCQRWRRYRFKVFRHDPTDPASLPKGAIVALIESRSGHLWVGTHGGELGRFDPRTERFRSYQGAVEGTRSPADHVTVLVEGPAGRLWVGTPSGLTRFDPVDGSWHLYRWAAGDPHALSGELVHDLAFDPAGALWVASNGGLDRFDPASGRATRVGPGLESGLGPGEVSAVGGIQRRDRRDRLRSPAGDRAPSPPSRRSHEPGRRGGPLSLPGPRRHDLDRHPRRCPSASRPRSC